MGISIAASTLALEALENYRIRCRPSEHLRSPCENCIYADTARDTEKNSSVVWSPDQTRLLTASWMVRLECWIATQEKNWLALKGDDGYRYMTLTGHWMGNV